MNQEFQTTQSLQLLIRKPWQCGRPFWFLSFAVWFFLSSHSIFHWSFYARSVFQNSTELHSLLVAEHTNKKYLVGGPIEENSLTNSIFLIWHFRDHSVFNNLSVLKHLPVWWQTTDGLLNSGQLEYHIFHTASTFLRIMDMGTLQTSAVQRPHAVAAGNHSHHPAATACFTALQQLLSSASLAAAMQCCSGGHRRAGQRRRRAAALQFSACCPSLLSNEP